MRECYCGDGCEPDTDTDCCEVQRPRCSTAPVFDTDGAIDVIVCRSGFGCSENPQSPLEYEAEGLDLIAREEYETSP